MMGVLGRLKFISKGEEHQVYKKPIPNILVTSDMQNSETYKTFIALSTSLIPLKKGRGNKAHGAKAMVIPKKATVASKKKLEKKKESSDEESDEQEERTIRRESICQHQSGGSSEGAGITLEVTDEPTRKYAVANEGAGTLPEVPNETKDKNKKAEDILWVSTDKDESNDDDEEDDDENEMNVAEKTGKKKDNEEVKGDDQATDGQPKISKLEKDVKEIKQVEHTLNTVETIDDTPEQSWFNKMIQAKKRPLMLDELMSTPIDFTAFTMNHLKLNKITRADLRSSVQPTQRYLQKLCQTGIQYGGMLSCSDRSTRLDKP
nr:hypothetical protein [Tanacetum cinerariifolium]